MPTDATIRFPPPSGAWGTVTHMAVPNPRWRWWAFWRPRAVTLTVPAEAAYLYGQQWTDEERAQLAAQGETRTLEFNRIKVSDR